MTAGSTPKTTLHVIPNLAILLPFLAAFAPQPSPTAQPRSTPGLTEQTWTVGDTPRTALVHYPDATAPATRPAPVIFAFHGHGGSSRNASRWNYHTLWPQAIVIYPQGLNTPGALIDPEGKLPGWQSKVGDQDDRDLKFFDAMLATLRKDHKIDDARIFATGHSNGGKFTYLLWETRAKEFAAFAPSAAISGLTIAHYTPKPLFHIASPTDPLVKYTWQQATLTAAEKLDACAKTPSKWQDKCDWYASETGTPVVTYIHDGGHTVPKDGPELIVKFFQKVAP